MWGVKPACAKFALKGVPKKKPSWAIMPGDEKADIRVADASPNILQRKISSRGSDSFKSLVNDNSIEQGSATDPKAQAHARGAIDSLRVVIVKQGGSTMEKGGTRWETKARRIRTKLGNRS